MRDSELIETILCRLFGHTRRLHECGFFAHKSCFHCNRCFDIVSYKGELWGRRGLLEWPRRHHKGNPESWGKPYRYKVEWERDKEAK